VKTAPVIIRCDGSAAFGLGHVSRCLAIAGELRDLHDGDVRFAMRDPDSAGVAAVRASGYAVDPIAGDEWTDYGGALHELVTSRSARALVVDVRDALSRAALGAIRASGVLVVTIDDASERRLAADLAFYPPVPQVDEMDWTGFAGRRFADWEWVILRREFASGVAGDAPAIDVLVTMGGSDPAGMTEFALRALERLPLPLEVHVVVGPAFGRAFELIDVIARSRHAVHVSHAPPSIAPLMRASRMAVASFGVSAYELAACGVPAVHLCLTDDHARSSSVLHREGMALTLGVFGRVQPKQLSDAVADLMGHAGRRAEMAERARRLIDGRGATRVAALVAETLTS
jgi:spore coat polysaccharide biosynthesis predicted glycosyltransferase SpsG